ncbi:hypothetical protein P1J78_20905 [Psychromarinibacter sp. C21-152]|uniref:Uncharacterized protein n=1 Tax=Psychromarinibacter sediminicola TaxID=3033385 RepID=A0AAE3NW39_9RHOB|nr:hypothetical protein [Psychromarinibacter sediminicola]MDF0603207.1 hypothetical protein [Psychromarinibacter sediminicola]
MGYEVSKEAKTLVNTAKGEFGKASVALVKAATGLALALQNERVAALAIPAARRPKIGEIKEAIRAEFGGLEKEGNRQAYDLCSLAFRVHAKLDKEAESVLSEAVAKGVDWTEGQVSALAGRRTVDAWKAWVMGEKTKPVEKPAGEKVMAYLAKHGESLTDDDMAALAKWVREETAKRKRLAEEVAEANAA